MVAHKRPLTSTLVSSSISFHNVPAAPLLLAYLTAMYPHTVLEPTADWQHGGGPPG